MGASTVMWTTPDPCLMLSESDSIFYTNFEFCEKKIIDILKIYQSTKKAVWDDKKSKKYLHILEDGASSK